MHERQSFQFILRHAPFSKLGEQMHITKDTSPVVWDLILWLNSHSEHNKVQPCSFSKSCLQ